MIALPGLEAFFPGELAPSAAARPASQKKKLSHYAARSCIAFACVGCRETTVWGMSLIEGKGRVVVGGVLYEAPRRAPGTSVRQAKTNKPTHPDTQVALSISIETAKVQRTRNIGPYAKVS